MNEAQRRREIKDYYLGISADEITSYLTPASFDLWESVARYRRATDSQRSKDAGVR